QLLDGYYQQIQALDCEEKQVVAALDALVDQSGSTWGELCGLCTRSVAELLVKTGDARRFTEGGDRRFNGPAPLPASTAEGPGETLTIRKGRRTEPHTTTNRSRCALACLQTA